MIPDRDAAYRVAGYPGIAFRFDALAMDRWWDGFDDENCEEPNGMWEMHMIGDDRTFIIDPDDCEELDQNVCSCGQIGCGWH